MEAQKYVFLYILYHLFFAALVCGIEPQKCKKDIENCEGSSCDELVSCYHGDCNPSGQCECDLCWEGASCDQYVDRYRPVFLDTFDQVLIADPWAADPFYTARAYDGDLGSTCPVESIVCECAETRYGFVSGNHENLFFINNITGDVYVREAGLLHIGNTYELTIAAYGGMHSSGNTMSKMELKVTVDNLHHHLLNELQEEVFIPTKDEVHSRSKRAIEDENYKTEFNFTLLTGEAETMEVGRRLDYRLEINVPKTSGMGLTVELFTKDVGNGNYTPVLALFNVEIENPSGLIFTNKDGPHIEMLLSEEITTAYDRAIVTFGDVKNPSDGHKPIVMLFSITQIKNPTTVYDSKYLVTAGAEYDKETYVWVGQSEVTVHNSTDERLIEVDILGSNEIAMDSAGVFVMMSHIAIRSDNFTVEVLAPEERDVVTVGNLGVKDFDVNYDPVPQNIYFYNTTLFGSDDDVIYTSAQLYLGIMTNVGPYVAPRDPGNVINITFAIYSLNNETNLGKEVTVTVNIFAGREKLITKEIPIKIVERKQADKMVTPKQTISLLTAPSASNGDMVMYTFWSNLTNSGYADFVLEVVVPRDNNNLPRLEACSARLWNYKGSFDIPYVNSTFIDPEIKNGKYVFKFNRVHVTGQRNPPIYNDSMIYVNLIVKVSSLAVNKVDVRLTPNVMIGTQGTADKAIKVDPVVIAKSTEVTHPTMSVENAVEWSKLYVGGAIVMNVTLGVPLFQGYSDVVFQSSGESDPPLPAVRICRAELSDVGRNLPCLRMHQDEVNMNSTKYSLSNPKTRKKNDVAVVTLGDVGALPVVGMNHATISVVVEIPEGSIIKEGEPFPIRSGLKIEERDIWGAEANYNMSKGPPPPLAEDKMPDANAEYDKEKGTVPGHLAKVEIVVITKIQSISNYSMEIEALSKDVSMCGLKVKSFGRNLPCIDMDTEPFYYPHDNPLDGNKVAGLRFNALSNVGFRSNPDHDVLRGVALVRISPSCKKREVKLEWRVLFGGGVRQGSVNLKVDLDSASADLSVMAKEPKALNFKKAYPDKSISWGTPAVVDLEVSLEPGSLAPVLVSMQNGDFAKRKFNYDVCLGGIWFRGKNYPCFSPVQVESNFSVSDFESGRNDSAVYNLGLVCNTFVDNKEEENKVTVRMAVRPIDDGNLKGKESINLEGYATVGSHSKKINTVSFPIAKTADQVETEKNASLKLVNPEPIPIRIHQRLWIPFNITIPQDALLKVEVEARAPVKDSRAIMTVHNIRLVSGGVNIPCPMLYPQPKVTFTPVVKTTQSDIIKGYLGYFTNLGLTHKMNMASEGDDDLTVEVEVEMSDHPAADHKANFFLAFSAQVGRSALLVQQPMLVWRDGTERADLDVEVKVDSTKTYQSGDSINVTLNVKHKKESTAEPVNATVRLYLPPYVEFNKKVFNNATVVSEVEFKTAAGGLDIVFPQFLFSDSATVVVGLLADPQNKRGFGRGEVNATTPYRTLCIQNFREDPTPNPTTAETIVSCGPVDYIMYVVNSQECYKSLGLYNPKKIYKCQLSASSAAKKETGPFNIRMGSKRGWSPALRLGPHKPYYQVDFLRPTRLAKLEFIKMDDYRAVTKYRLQYSNTGSDWLYGNEVTELEYKKDKAMSELQKPIQTRFVRVIIEESEKGNEDTRYTGLKMEMYGCHIGEKTATVSCAKDDPTWYSDDKNKNGRHFSVDTGRDIAYFCDLEYDMENLVCFSSTDSGNSWRTLPKSFGGILGYDKKIGRTYAVDQRKRAYIASDDGVTWVSVDFNEVNSTMLKKSFYRSQPVPAFTSEDISMLETKTGRWEASFDGLMYEGRTEPRARWSRCCKTTK